MNKILVGLDGSKREGGVLGAAIALARKLGAQLVLFRSVGVPHDLPREVYMMPPEEIPNLLQERARRDLEKREADVPPELRGGVVVHLGTPYESIQRAAREVDADFIVIGAHGYDAFDRVIGTTAAKLVNHADRTVVVVRAPERITRT